MRELFSPKSFDRLKEETYCVVAMLPRWSLYSSKLKTTLNNVINLTDIPIYGVLEDSREKNFPLTQWLNENGGASKLMGVFTGAGSLIFVSQGRIESIAPVCWQKSMEEIVNLINKNKP